MRLPTIAKLSSRVEHANAKFAEFLGHFPKGETVIITQEGRRMTLTGRDLMALLGALTWEQAREKAPDPKLLALRTVIYPMEIADLMTSVKAEQQHTLLADPHASLFDSVATMHRRHLTFTRHQMRRHT
jgi:hypothetical protein